MNRLLSLDGGGMRGVFTLEILQRVQNLLRDRYKNPNLVLADYFNFIGGTSTGAIIGTCLALGMRVGDVTKFYEESGPAMFAKARLLRRFWYKYDSTPLAKMLQGKFGADTEFGTEPLRDNTPTVRSHGTAPQRPDPGCRVVRGLVRRSSSGRRLAAGGRCVGRFSDGRRTATAGSCTPGCSGSPGELDSACDARAFRSGRASQLRRPARNPQSRKQRHGSPRD